jgi:hypothetical protein
MIVKCRSLLDDRVNVGNGDKNLCGPVGHGFGNGKLVQITRIIIVDGAPEKVPEITGRFLSLRRWPVDSVEFGERLGWKIWNKSSFQHRPMGNSLQDGAVLSVVCSHHNVTFLEYLIVISCLTNAFSPPPPSFATPANKQVFTTCVTRITQHDCLKQPVQRRSKTNPSLFAECMLWDVEIYKVEDSRRVAK